MGYSTGLNKKGHYLSASLLKRILHSEKKTDIDSFKPFFHIPLFY